MLKMSMDNMMTTKLVLLSVLCWAATTTEAASDKRHALDRPPLMGNLYDRKYESASPLSLYWNGPPEKSVRVVQTPSNFTATFYSGLIFQDMVDQVGLSQPEKLSLRLEIPRRSDFVFNRDNENSRVVGGTFSQRILTEKHYLDFRSKDALKRVSRVSLERMSATDVIVAQQYGFESYVKFYRTLSPKEDAAEAREKVREFVKDVEDAYKKAGGFNFKFNMSRHPAVAEKWFWMSSSTSSWTDAPLWTLEQTFKYLHSIRVNMGSSRGEVISFDLLPLSEVKKYFSNPNQLDSETEAVQTDFDPPIFEIPLNLSQSIVETVSTMHLVQNEISDFVSNAKASANIIPSSTIDLVHLFGNAWSDNMTDSFYTLRDTVIAYRGGSTKLEAVETAHNQLSGLLSEFGGSNEASGLGSVGMNQKFPFVKEYLDLAKNISSRGLKIINRSGSSWLMLLIEEKSFMVLKYKMEWIRENREEWNNVVSILVDPQYQNMWEWFEVPKRFLMDCDVWPEHCGNLTKIEVHRYDFGKVYHLGDYLCAVSESFLSLAEQRPFGLLRSSWIIKDAFQEPYVPCRTGRVLERYHGAFLASSMKIIV